MFERRLSVFAVVRAAFSITYTFGKPLALHCGMEATNMNERIEALEAASKILSTARMAVIGTNKPAWDMLFRVQQRINAELAAFLA